MAKNLDIMEEYEILESIKLPHLSYVMDTLTERKKVARNVLNRKTEDILLVDKTGFYIDSVFAGLNEKSIEYFAKYAPVEYKKNLMKIFQDKEMMDGMWETVKSMDDDEGNGSIQNQNRIKSVIQYIKDNQIVFII